MNKRLIITFLLGVFLCPFLKAQKTTISPYSRFGYGIEREGKFVRNFGLAGAGNALESRRHINPKNPASYHMLNLTSFEAGLEMDNLWLSGGGQEQFENTTYFSHLLFGMPIINQKWGMTFGMMPLTSVGYDYQTETELTEEIGTVTNLFEGSGGLNQILMGHGFKLFDRGDTLDRLSFGVNAAYVLGKIDNKERIIYEDLAAAFNTRKTDALSFGDARFDFGLLYHRSLKKGLSMSAGLTYAYSDKINAKRTLLIESYTGNIGLERIKDTVSSVFDEKTSVQLPGEYGVGFSLMKQDKWTITMDLDYRDWSSVNSDSTNFADAFGARAGIELQRDDTRKKDGRLRTYLAKARFGGRYQSSYIQLGGDQLQEIAGSFGISLYRSSRVSGSTMIRGMNFGMEIGMRGKDNGQLFQEQFVNIMVAITVNDRWFIKRKYD